MYVVAGLVFFAVASSLYVHVFDPFTKSFLADHDIDIVRSGDVFESDYSALCKKVLIATYSISGVGLVFVGWLAYRKSVTVVFVGLLVAILIFYQIADYLQHRWLLESYNVVVFGV